MIRASRYVKEDVTPQLLELTNGFVQFEWESSPGMHLTWGQRQLSSTLAQVILMAFPSLMAVIGSYVIQVKTPQLRYLDFVSFISFSIIF